MSDGGKWCYPGTDVLINKYDIRDKDTLEKFEIQKFSVQMISLQLHPEKIQHTCDEKHLVALNEFLFGDLYEWSGKYREEDMYKSERVLSGGSAEYSKHRDIKNHLKIFFKRYNAVNWKDDKVLAENATSFLSDLWGIHPFREGNTRTCTTFLWSFLQAKSIELDLELFKNNPMYVRDSLVMANYGMPEYLSKIIKGALDCEETLPLDQSIERAKEQYQIAKEDYKAFKEHYSIIKNQKDGR